MTVLSIFSRFAATATLAAMALFSPMNFAADLPANKSYVKLSQAQPADEAEQIEVLEFFAYSCPYCAMFSPYVQNWGKTLPNNTVIKRIPVAFNANMEDLQRMYYTLEALGRLDLHHALFDAIHKEKQELFNQKALTEWAVKQGLN